MKRPLVTRTIGAIEVLQRSSIEGAELVSECARRCSLVTGAFRQESIRARWIEALPALGGASLPVISLRVECSSGTFMRSLAFDLGAALGVPSFAWKIRRTAAGPLRLEGARRLP